MNTIRSSTNKAIAALAAGLALALTACGGGSDGGPVSGKCEAAPAAPTNVVATAASSTEIDLSWAAVTPPADCSVTYKVLRDGVEIATALPNASFADTGLQAQSTHSYVIQAVDAAGSVDSAAVTATTLADQPNCAAAANAPTGLTATAASATQINLAWTAVTAPANCSVTYNVYRNGNATPVATGLTGASYSDTGLTASTTYTYTVRAVDAAGVSADSNSATATTPASACAAIPAAPTGLTATATFANQVDLAWSAVTAPPNCSVTYTVYRGSTAVATGLNVLSFSDSNGINPSTTYTYTVRAVDAAGSSSASNAATANMPVGPASVSYANLTTMSVTVNWTAPSSGGTVSGYELVYTNTTTGVTSQVFTLASTAQSTTIFLLTSGSTYRVTVRAKFEGGGVSANSVVTFTVP